MDVTVQKAIQELITALIRSLGPNHGKLLTLMRTCPPGAESLALRVLTIFTEHGRPSAQLVALVKGLISERDLDARSSYPSSRKWTKSEILAVVMQQIMDEPILPVLFLRTVIQAVKTYKSLIGFVSTTLLSRLITKKIWTNPPLWEGFIRCAKVIAPASFSALLQLPKDQLRELVDKQPSLKSGLRDYVIKKAPNKARGAGYLDIFGEGEDNNDSSTPQASTPVPQPEPSLAAPAA
ncbi:Symplekin tight junction protein [Salix suchowensis]|nr:Symplekin tight junction protein [Salix suchowensis]